MSTSDGISVSGPSSTNTSPPQTAIDAPASVAQSSVAGDLLKCEWLGCNDRLPNPEKLYDHVCEKHIGRKSTNNLNLTCAWGNCRTTTVKRDHITSHIRVHVPLKPHKCDFCQKAFKRPQDLKKHVKTHAEDPNFQASPEPQRASHAGANGVFAGQSKHVADLQHLAATASGYYPDHHALSGAGVYPTHYNTAASNPSAYHGPSNHYQSNYMTTLYPVNSSNMSEYEIRKKATFDALNEFFGDIKTRQLDPGTYHQVGQRLMGLQNLPAMGAADYGQPGPAVAPAPTAPMNNHYSLPMSNIRSKNDLQHIDQFLEQLQATVYEHETQAGHAAQAGIHQAGNHYMHAGFNMRSSHSPPMTASHSSSVSGVSGHHILPPIASSPSDGTPALTPASTVMSYNSPGSVHSSTVSPISRGSNAAMYPTLPSVSDVSGSALPSALASSFDIESRRRYSAGLLQRSRAETSDTEMPDIGRLDVRSPSLASVDPALTGDSDRKSATPPGSSKDESVKTEVKDAEEDDGRADPDWLTKVRVLEAIRSIVKQRLENNEYEEDDDTDTVKADSPPAETQDEKDARELYPVLRAVQEAD